MFCSQCGKELKEGARFCNACGASTDKALRKAQASKDSATSAEEIFRRKGTSSDSPQAGLAERSGSDGVQPARKISPIVVVAIVAVVLACIMVVVFVLAQRPGGGGGQAQQARQPVQSSASVSESAATSASASASAAVSEQGESQEPTLTPEQKAIAGLDGWWEGARHGMNGYRPVFGHIHDGQIDWYLNDNDPSVVTYGNTVNIVKAERFAENGAEGWRFFTDVPQPEPWAYYQADGQENELPIYKTAFGYGNVDTAHYNTDSLERAGLHRVTDSSPSESAGLLEKAKALAAERLGDSSSAGGDAANSSAQDTGAGSGQADAQAKARADAEAAGKTVLEGTVFIGTEEAWAAREGLPRAPNPGSDFTYAGLVLDEPATVSARNADGGTAAREPYVERSGQYVLLASSYPNNETDAWAPYDGQRVLVAFPEFGSFSDSLGVLFSFRGTGELIAAA